MTVLVIDDSRFVQLAIERALREAGNSTIAASDGEEGFRTALQQPPDLILLDVMLPRLPGTSVLSRLKHNPVTSSIPVIVLTGLSGLDEARLKSEGADGLLEKSYLDLEGSCQVLLSLVERTLAKDSSSSQRGLPPFRLRR
jgi:two-component system, cell cycle response regulator DivK